MAKIKAVKATQELIDAMKGNLRDADISEVWNTSRETADDALQRGFDRSVFCWIVLLGDKPFFCFGVVSASFAFTHTGHIWALGTDDIARAKVAVARRSVSYIKQMLGYYDVLENYVAANNFISIQWLKYCGFNIEAPAKYGIEQELFCKFNIRREV